jgi:RNA polymerase sigma-70 factor (ECF subfamily)
MTEMPSQPDDATLVWRSRAGDREAFGCLYDRYAGLVRAMAYDDHARLTDACDITQEAFLRAWQKLSALQEPASFGAWVVGIARQIGREQHRAAGRSRQVPLGADIPEPAAATCHEADQLSTERSCLLLQKIAELPEKERLAIHAFYLQGQGLQPVIEALQLSRAGVYALLKRACRSLASKLRCLAPEQANQK